MFCLMDSNVGHVIEEIERTNWWLLVVEEELFRNRPGHKNADVSFYPLGITKATYRYEYKITSVLEHLSDPKNTTVHSWDSIKTLGVLLGQRYCNRYSCPWLGHEAYRRRRTDPFILSLHTRWVWMVEVIPQSHFLAVSSPSSRCHWPRRLNLGFEVACGFESRRGHGCLSVVSVVSVVCCWVEFSATGWSLVQRSPADCGASLCDRRSS